MEASKRAFDALLENPEFILLYVPENAADGERMKLVRPATHPEIQHKFRTSLVTMDEYDNVELIQLPYYALSHMWGLPSEPQKQHMWHGISDFVDDEDDNPVAPIPMRAEKRSTLLALLRARPGYWWIDVLCARVSTPLVIMGDIYKYCKACYAMADCSPDILEGLYGKGQQMDNEEDEWREGKDEEERAELFVQFIKKWSDQFHHMYQLIRCKWWNRTWTWQEASLPLYTYLLAEASGDSLEDHLVEMNDFRFFAFWNTLEDPFMIEKLEQGLMQALTNISKPWRERQALTSHNALTRSSKGQPSMYIFAQAMLSLGNSTRTCMDPVDYVYGVLGMLDLDVPRLKCHQEVWQHFLEKLEGLIQQVHDNHDDGWLQELGFDIPVSISLSDKAKHVDLSTAQNMADVYGGLFNVTYEDE